MSVKVTPKKTVFTTNNLRSVECYGGEFAKYFPYTSRSYLNEQSRANEHIEINRAWLCP